MLDAQRAAAHLLGHRVSGVRGRVYRVYGLALLRGSSLGVLALRVEGLRNRVQDLARRAASSSPLFRIQGVGCRVYSIRCRVWGKGCLPVEGMRVEGFRVES